MKDRGRRREASEERDGRDKGTKREKGKMVKVMRAK